MLSQLAYNNHLKPQTHNSLNCTNSFTRIIYALYRLKTSPYFHEENVSPMLTYMYMSWTVAWFHSIIFILIPSTMKDLGFKQLKLLPKIMNGMSYWCDCPVCWHSTETWILSRLSVLEAPPSYAPTQPSTTSQTQIKLASFLFQVNQLRFSFFKYCSTYMNYYIMCSASCYVNFNIYS